MLKEIKKRLRNRENIHKLLSSIGCQNINTREQKGTLITAQLPQKFYSPNRRAVQVRLNDNLTAYIRNMNDFSGDIFSLVSYIHHNKRGADINKDLHNSRNYICNVFGWDELKVGNMDAEIIVKEHTDCLLELMGEEPKVEIIPNDIIDESVVNHYLPLPSYDWKKEGISYATQVKYGVRFDMRSKRIVFPVRNRQGDLVGIKGRILKAEDSDIKYIYLHPCNASQEWYNYHIAVNSILKEKRVFIFEGEKSCMKMYEHGIYNTLSISSSDISDAQAKMLNDLSQDIEIILCYDNDKSRDEIKEQAQVFKKDVFAIYDKDKILPDKSSPIDSGIEVFNKLLDSYLYKIPFFNDEQKQ